MKTIYNVLLAAAALCIVVAIGLLLLGNGLASTGPFVIAALVCLAVGGLGSPRIRPHLFTIWVFASVATGMYYPQYFQNSGDFQYTRLIVPLIQIIMFGMGTAMSLKDFEGVIKMPKGVFVGLVCQFTIMPLVGLALAKSLGFEPEIAAGIVLIGSASSGVASNVMAFIAKTNLALSITLTAVATLLAPIVTPFLMQVLAGQFVEIDFVAMMISIIKMVIIPIILGLIFNKVMHGRAGWLDRSMPMLSMIAIAVVLVIIVASGRDNLLTIGPLLFVAAILHNAIGYFLGYWGCRLIRLDEQTCRTISLEVGMQNGGMATGLAVEMGKAATVGLAPAIFGPWMNISGSILANWWRNKPVEDAPAEVAKVEGEAAAL